MTDELIEEQNADNENNNGDEQAELLNKLANDSMNGGAADREENDEDEDDDDDDDDDEDNVNIVISDIVNKPYSASLQPGQQGSATGAAPNNASNLLSWQNRGLIKPGGQVGAAGGPNMPPGMAAGPGGVLAGGARQLGGPQAKGIDVDAPGTINNLPTYEYNLHEVNDEEKPWRKPGADITDYFNYDFNEETWNAYCVKQRRLREENAAMKAGMMMMPGGMMDGGGGGMMVQHQQHNPFQQSSGMPPMQQQNIPILNTQAGGSSGGGLNQQMGGGVGMMPGGGVVGMPNLPPSQNQQPGVNMPPLLPGSGGPNGMQMPPYQQHQNPMQPGNNMMSGQQGGYQNRMPFQPRYPPPGQIMQQQPGMGPGGQYQQMRPNDPNNTRRGMYGGSESNDNAL